MNIGRLVNLINIWLLLIIAIICFRYSTHRAQVQSPAPRWTILGEGGSGLLAGAAGIYNICGLQAFAFCIRMGHATARICVYNKTIRNYGAQGSGLSPRRFDADLWGAQAEWAWPEPRKPKDRHVAKGRGRGLAIDQKANKRNLAHT